MCCEKDSIVRKVFNMITILIPGVGAEGALGIIKQLRAAYGSAVNIIGLDINRCTAHQKFLDNFIVPPLRTSKEYYPFILKVIKKFNVNILWPLSTEELEYFALNKKKIEELTSTRVLIGDYEGINIANNKYKLYKYLQEKKVLCIAQYDIAKSYEELEKIAFELGYPDKKVCIKLTKGSGSRGFRILDENYNKLYSLLYDYPNNVVCNLKEIEQILKNVEKLPEIIVMEFLPGDEFDVDVLCYEGFSYYIIPRVNKKMYYGMSLITQTVQNSVIEEYTKEIIKKLNLSFIISLTFKMDKYNNPYLIEINPRVPGTIISTLNSGINYIELAIKLLYEQEIELDKEIKYGVTTVRYWEDCIL